MVNTASQALQKPAISLSLQSLIDARHDVIRHHSSRQFVHSDLPGQRTGTRRGQGLEFIDLRQYTASDDVRHIDWNVTARSTEPYTRLYREEREYVSTVVVDLRPLMFTGSTRLRAVTAGEHAARVLWQSNESGDRVAAMVIGATGVQQTRPAAGTRGVLQALELISSGFIGTQSLIDGSLKTNKSVVLSDALSLINNARNRSGNYIFISGFDTADDKNWNDALTVSAVTGQLKAVLLLDPIELNSLPSGVYEYRTHKERLSTRINSDSREQLSDELRRRIEKRQIQFTDAGISLLTVSTDASGADFLGQVVGSRLL